MRLARTKRRLAGTLATAALTASTMVVGFSAPPTANAAIPIELEFQTDYGPAKISTDVNAGVFTAGSLFSLLDLFGVNIGQYLPSSIDVYRQLHGNNPKSFYNAIDSVPLDTQVKLSMRLLNLFDINETLDAGLRAALVGTYGGSALPALQAYQRLAAGTRGEELPAGYLPVEQAPPAGENDWLVDIAPVWFTNPLNGQPVLVTPGYRVQKPSLPNTTALALLMLSNPLTPNGGLRARFAPLLNPFGIPTAMPEVEPVLPEGFQLDQPFAPESCTGDVRDRYCTYWSNWQGGAMLLPLALTLGWEYDFRSDFPVTLNPVSVLNAVIGGLLPTHAIRSIDTDEVLADLEAKAEAAEAAMLDVLNGNMTPEEARPALNAFYTARTKHLPLLEPLRLPVDLVNAVLGTHFTNPIADAIEPALRILVNIGYSDVVTPEDIKRNPELAIYGAYGRTLDQMNVATPLFSQLPLTFGEYLQVPGDVLKALVDGVVSVLTGRNPGTGHTNPLDNLDALDDLSNAVGDVIDGTADSITEAVTDSLADSPTPDVPVEAAADETDGSETATDADDPRGGEDAGTVDGADKAVRGTKSVADRTAAGRDDRETTADSKAGSQDRSDSDSRSKRSTRSAA